MKIIFDRAKFALLFPLLLLCPSGCERTPNSSGQASKGIILSTKVTTPEANASGFEAPVRLQAAEGEFISVEAPGYACPTMADVDGDGKDDLVVGQFKSGHLQFFKNISLDGQAPKFAAAQWLTTGKERAVVPGVW